MIWFGSQISRNYSRVFGVSVNRIIIIVKIVAKWDGIIHYTDRMMINDKISISTSAKNRYLMEHEYMRSCYAQLSIYNFSINSFAIYFSSKLVYSVWNKCAILLMAAVFSFVLIFVFVLLFFVFSFVIFVVYYCLTLTLIIFLCHNMTRV
jgi:hypothetical protein